MFNVMSMIVAFLLVDYLGCYCLIALRVVLLLRVLEKIVFPYFSAIPIYSVVIVVLACDFIQCIFHAKTDR